MPRAEVGSTKHLANKMKSKGLQRLRWYCQVCEKQCRDENGFKCHTQSESHVRAMHAVGSNARAAIADYAGQFERDFVRQLRTMHGTKPIHINRFYQEYIADKEHVHMNATRYSSLTEFAKYLGREGICKVEENEKGLHIAWIDNSPAALRRQAALQQRERQERGDEEMEQRLIREQIARARAEVQANGEAPMEGEAGDVKDETEDEPRELKPTNQERIILSFGVPMVAGSQSPMEIAGESAKTTASNDPASKPSQQPSAILAGSNKKVNIDLSAASGAPKHRNVFATAGKKASNPLARPKKSASGSSDLLQGKKMSEAERIMREEMDSRKRKLTGPSQPQHHAMGVGFSLGAGPKKQRVG